MDASGQVVFFSPTGRAIAASREQRRLGRDPVDALIRENRRRGVDPQWDTIRPKRHHIAGRPWQLEADAWDALERAADIGAGCESAGVPGRTR